jgi:hypothetical protein
MRFPFVAADTSTRDNDLKCRFLASPTDDARWMMRNLAFNGSLFLDANQLLDLLIHRQDGPTGDR